MKLLCRVLQLLVLIPHLVYGFPTTGVLDTFDTNQDPIAGIWTNLYSDVVVGCRANGGVLVKQSGSPADGCYVTTPYNSAQQEVFATLPNATNHATTSVFKIIMCLQGGLGTGNVDGYGFEVQKVAGAANDQVGISKLTNGTFTLIGAAATQEVVNNDKVGGERLTNGQMNFWYDDGGGWANLFNRTDTTYNCSNGNLGVQVRSSTFHVDSFGGGNTVAGGEVLYLFAPIQWK